MTRRLNMAMLLPFWWAAPGRGISWKKIDIGFDARWIGTDVYVMSKLIVGIAKPEKYCIQLEKEASRMPNLKRTQREKSGVLLAELICIL